MYPVPDSLCNRSLALAMRDCDDILEIVPDAWHAMVDHARRELPNECCGFLVGTRSRADMALPMRNALASPIAYYADERDLFAAMRWLRDGNRELSAIYHSHPTSPAIPSNVDLRENYYGDVPRIILSMRHDPPDVRGFRLGDDQFRELTINHRGAQLHMIAMQRTLVLLKPDSVQRRLVGRILSRFEDKGLRIVGLKLQWFSRELAEQLYAVHRGKDFYQPLLDFMTRSPALAMVLEGPDAILVVREMLGSTAATQAKPGTIRGDFGLSSRLNLVHASDSPESAERESAILFTAAELYDYALATASLTTG